MSYKRYTINTAIGTAIVLTAAILFLAFFQWKSYTDYHSTTRTLLNSSSDWNNGIMNQLQGDESQLDWLENKLNVLEAQEKTDRKWDRQELQAIHKSLDHVTVHVHLHDQCCP